MMKNPHFILSLFIALLHVSCGQNKPTIAASKVMDSTTSRSGDSDPNAPEVSIEAKGSGGNDAWLLYWYNWYTNGKAQVPKCGPREVDKRCYEPKEAGTASCVNESKEVQGENYRLGYYLERVDSYPFCKKKCTPSKPKCDGISCIPNVLTYSGKKILEWTQACQGACKDAIVAGMEFPYECKNLNDGYDRTSLIAEIEEERKKILADPNKKAQLAQLSAIKAEREAIDKNIEKMKKAEDELPAWLTTVYNPTIKSLVEDMKKADDRILQLYTRVRLEIGPVQKAAVDVQTQFVSGLPKIEQLEENRKSLESVRPKACLAYDFSSAVGEAKVVEDKLKLISDELLARLVQVGNAPLYETGKSGVANLLSKVKSTPVDEDVLNGSFFREVCEHYRKMIVLNSLGFGLSNITDLRSGIADLMTNLNTMINRIDTFNDGLEFKSSVRSQALTLVNALQIAKAHSQWNRGNRLAMEAMKALHLVIIPSIELNQTILPETKEAFISEVKTTLETAMRDWNRISKEIGMEGMVTSRRVKMGRKLNLIRHTINARTEESSKLALLDQFHTALGKASLEVNKTDLQIKRPEKTPEALIAHDDELSELENIVSSFEKTLMGGAQ